MYDINLIGIIQLATFPEAFWRAPCSITNGTQHCPAVILAMQAMPFDGIVDEEIFSAFKLKRHMQQGFVGT